MAAPSNFYQTPTCSCPEITLKLLNRLPQRWGVVNQIRFVALQFVSFVLSSFFANFQGNGNGI